MKNSAVQNGETGIIARAKRADQRNSRSMRTAELNGMHSFPISRKRHVHIYLRNEQYLARWRSDEQQHGYELGKDEAVAFDGVIELVGRLKAGTFQARREERAALVRKSRADSTTLRQLIADFLEEKKQLRGESTAKTYRTRLSRALEYFESLEVLRNLPLARQIEKTHILKFRTWLLAQEVARNGHHNSQRKRISPKSVQLTLETLRDVFRWGMDPSRRLLPVDFLQPVSKELLGLTSRKDPLRGNPIPVATRIRLVSEMQIHELPLLCLQLILPVRMEDIAGLLVSDIDWNSRVWRIGDRFDGNDFTKGRVSYHLPLPLELIPVLRFAAAGRSAGPLFLKHQRQRTRSISPAHFESESRFAAYIQEALQAESANTPADRKKLIRVALANAGGFTEDQLSRKWRMIFDRTGVERSVRPYDLKHATTTDMRSSGMGEAELQYLTGHAMSGIVNEYAGVDPARAMGHYFASVANLLQAIQTRALDLGITSRSQHAEEGTADVLDLSISQFRGNVASRIATAKANDTFRARRDLIKSKAIYKVQ